MANELQKLMHKIDALTEALLTQLDGQKAEIDALKSQNQKLEITVKNTLEQINGYVTELEEIKKSLCR